MSSEPATLQALSLEMMDVSDMSLRLSELNLADTTHIEIDTCKFGNPEEAAPILFAVVFFCL